ncbi:MAG: hypothetical protein KC503_25335, partial [Myxococcales bacterium]|nr:hypothetical protein [Myxococcales bacterium]
PEIRAYPFGRDVPKLFGQISAGFGYGLALSQIPAATEKRFNFNANVSIGGGPGYGRIIDIGQRIRLRRLAWVLRKAGLLAGEIDQLVGNKIIAAWYALRNNIGNFQQLGHTLRILRKAGLLTRAVDAATAYRLVRILDDPQLYDRKDGIMLRAGYGYARTLRKDADDTTMAFAYATAELQRQLGTTRAIGGTLRFFYNNWGTPDTYSVDVAGHYDWYFYNRAFDPLGALGVDARFSLNNQPGGAFDNGGVGWRASGGLSYTRFFNRGSLVRLTASGGVDTNQPFFMLHLEARYGLVRGSFVNAK